MLDSVCLTKSWVYLYSSNDYQAPNPTTAPSANHTTSILDSFSAPDVLCPLFPLTAVPFAGGLAEFAVGLAEFAVGLADVAGPFDRSVVRLAMIGAVLGPAEVDDEDEVDELVEGLKSTLSMIYPASESSGEAREGLTCMTPFSRGTSDLNI